jgi:hypothetical protein
MLLRLSAFLFIDICMPELSPHLPSVRAFSLHLRRRLPRAVALSRWPAGHSEQLETPVISRQVDQGSQEGTAVVLRHPAQAVGVDCVFNGIEQEPP